MIKNFRQIKNVGSFQNLTSGKDVELGKLTLIYGDNGMGKTTLAEVLRSVAEGDASIINARKSLGAADNPRIVIEQDGDLGNVLFQDGRWSSLVKPLVIFDDAFVEKNVYSGLEVGRPQRQNLHSLTLGEKGVELDRRHRELVERIEQHNADLREKASAIPAAAHLGGLPVDDFCALSPVSDVDVQIQSAERELRAARASEAVKSKPLFSAIELPPFDTGAINAALQKDLPALTREAEARVREHIENLGSGGENWIADGMARQTDSKCPFCGQEVAGLPLIAHYQAYFSDAYANLKKLVAKTLEDLRKVHFTNANGDFERAVRVATEGRQFWSDFCDVPEVSIDTAAIVENWHSAGRLLVSLLEAKQASPLEQTSINAEVLQAIHAYEEHRREVKALSDKLVASNAVIKEVQSRAAGADPLALEKNLSLLRTTKIRHSQEIISLCNDYLQEKEAKSATEKNRDEARKSLTEYRNKVFPAIQDAVNGYLLPFNAGFRLERFIPVNSRGGSDCAYNVVINGKPVAVKAGDNPKDEPFFGNTLSAGDRNTLALAFFLSTLDQNPVLAETVVVIDDPMTSLDEHRTLTTVQTIRDLSKRAGQVIVLSHDKDFLLGITQGISRAEYRALEIIQDGEGSSIRLLDVTQSRVGDHYRWSALLENYASNQSGSAEEAASAIRLYLETCVRVAYSVDFKQRETLGTFLNKCKAKLGKPDEIMDERDIKELASILEYANPFHHASGESRNINAQELQGFVKRALAFVRRKGR